MKYYTSIKLNTKPMIGPWSMKNAIIIIVMAVIFIPLLIQRPMVLTPFFFYIIGAVEVDGRTLIHRAKVIISFMISDKKYSLKEALESENNRDN